MLPHRQRWWWLLAASCYFYMAFVPMYILILGGTIVVDYFAGLYLEKAQGRAKRWGLVRIAGGQHRGAGDLQILELAQR